MTILLLILIFIIVLVIHYYPGLLHKIKTTYLRPEISIFELLVITITGLLVVSVFHG